MNAERGLEIWNFVSPPSARSVLDGILADEDYDALLDFGTEMIAPMLPCGGLKVNGHRLEEEPHRRTRDKFVRNFTRLEKDTSLILSMKYATLVARKQQPRDAKSTRLFQTVESKNGAFEILQGNVGFFLD